MDFENRARPNAAPATPDAGFNKVAGYFVGYGVFETMPDIIQAGFTQHRMTVYWPVAKDGIMFGLLSHQVNTAGFQDSDNRIFYQIGRSGE